MENVIKTYRGYSTSVKPYREVNFGDKYYEYDTQKWFTWSLNHIWVEDNIQAVYTIDLINNHFILYANGVEVGNENLSPYVNDEETFVASGVLNPSTFIATFTRNTGTTFNVNLSALFTSVWQLDGNTNGVLKNFGTKDNYDLPIIINNVEVGRFKVGGNFGVGVTNPTEKLDVNGNIKIPYGKWIGWVVDYVSLKFSAEAVLDSYQGVDININRYPAINNGWFRIFNRINNVANLIMQLKQTGEIRFPLITDAQNDITFTKNVVSKPDGTLGIQDLTSINLIPVSVFPTAQAGAIVFKTPENKHFGYDGTNWNALY